MFKKIALGVFVLIYIILFWFSACAGLTNKQSHINHTRLMDKIYENNNSNLPNANFAFLIKHIYTKYKADGSIIYCQKGEEGCNSTEEYTTASGTVISKNRNKLKILTVDHWCSEQSIELISLIYKNADGEYVIPDFWLDVNFYGKSHKAKILESDPFNDICILEIESEFAYKAKNIKFADNLPKIGDDVYALSAPSGIASPKIRMQFHGSWSGCDDNLTGLPYCYYTIPAAPGSSGSGVFNSKGELVSIISISMTGFDQISGGPKLYYIEKMAIDNK